MLKATWLLNGYFSILILYLQKQCVCVFLNEPLCCCKQIALIVYVTFCQLLCACFLFIIESFVSEYDWHNKRMRSYDSWFDVLGCKSCTQRNYPTYIAYVYKHICANMPLAVEWNMHKAEQFQRFISLAAFSQTPSISVFEPMPRTKPLPQIVYARVLSLSFVQIIVQCANLNIRYSMQAVWGESQLPSCSIAI